VISSEKELATLKELIGKLELEENQSQNKSWRIGDAKTFIVKFKHLLQNRRGDNYYQRNSFACGPKVGTCNCCGQKGHY
jgi:hypothetical protein